MSLILIVTSITIPSTEKDKKVAYQRALLSDHTGALNVTTFAENIAYYNLQQFKPGEVKPP